METVTFGVECMPQPLEFPGPSYRSCLPLILTDAEDSPFAPMESRKCAESPGITMRLGWEYPFTYMEEI